MSLAIRDSASRVADAAREIGGDVATALAWLEAARGDISRNRPSVSHAPDAVRVPTAGAVHESEWRRAAGDRQGNGKTMKRIEIYTKDWCAFSARAKALLDAKGLDYHEIDVTSDAAREREMIARSGRRTVPQVFIDGEPFGGSDDLARLEATGALDRILGGDLSRRRPARAA